MVVRITKVTNDGTSDVFGATDWLTVYVPLAATAAESGVITGSAAAAPPQSAGSATAEGLNMVTYMTGLDSNGQVTSPNFFSWESPNGSAHEWMGNGSAAPIVTVSFDPGSGWTFGEENSFLQALSLWSDVANFQYEVVASGGEITLARGASGSGAATSYYYQPTASGIGSMTSADISIDTSAYGWQKLDSFSYVGGYGLLTTLHELGHALGLGHPGSYNESTPTASAILYPGTDTRQYTVMSYNDPPSSAAVYNLNYQTTPGQYDILALQRIYGVSTDTNNPLNRPETFGFNSTVTATLYNSAWAWTTALLPEFDFTQNTSPVVTLYDTANQAGNPNVLDLSGFSTASVVDLNPGTFTSADGMTNNIGIAFNTWIDKAIGGAGNDTFYVNGQSDTIDGGGGTNTVVFSNPYADYAAYSNGTTITVSVGGFTDTLLNIQTLQFADQTVSAASIPCFVAGTSIGTPSGETPVELLAEGDLVATADGTVRPVVWVGRRRFDLAAHPQPELAAPIRICAGAFADGLPRRDLLVSPDHALLVGGVLVPAKLLVNGITIHQDFRPRHIDYIHVELDRHDILLAEGLPAESYLDTGNRAMFANAGSAMILHPDWSVATRLQSWDVDACRPLVGEGPALRAARRLLDARLAEVGWTLTDDPGLRLAALGREFTPLAADPSRAVFVLPQGVQNIGIWSRFCVPASVGIGSDDTRTLGVAVAGISIRTGSDSLELSADHPALGRGWHAVERRGVVLRRWTDGNALISLGSPLEVQALVELRFAGSLRYWMPTATLQEQIAA